MFCGYSMAFGLGKKNRRKETTEGVSEEAPRIIDICQDPLLPVKAGSQIFVSTLPL